MLTFVIDLKIDIFYKKTQFKLKKTIYLIRHGETDYNKQGIVQGSGINSSLNETGILQANMFYEEFKSIEFDNIYTSKLKRTQESVHPFIKNGGQFISLTELNEINWGVVEGQKPDSAANKMFHKTMKLWQQGNYHLSVEGGETPFEMQTRQKIGISKILKATHESKILIACHGRAMRSLLCTMLNKPLSKMDEFPHSNLCLYILEYQNEKFNLKLSNSTRHLNNK